MRCMIQWIDSAGNKTPDTNEAVCLVQPFDPRVPVGNAKFEVKVRFSFNERIREYHANEGSVVLEDGLTAVPICEEHLKRLPAFWRALPFPKQPKEEWHQRVKNQAPAEVLESIINSFPENCEAILKELLYHPGDDYWSFVRWGIFVGIERDGYIHS